ncbi:unnamed protein product [Peronospora destructor]|uniref:VWFA domain-containing protein n=1 Tax=Peronospora destructor TaxID=86335 RepID=A0AAV0U4Z4_9STRA|nr:unnamed protein product [Peronospora destructor]
MDMPSTELAVGSMGDVLYVVNASDGSIYSSQLSITVRSDAYRIQRSGNGAKSSRQGDQKGTATQHWLRLFYHVFEKFPLTDISEENHFATCDAKAVCVEYLNRVMVDLRRLNKPLCGLDLVKSLKYRCSELTGNHTSLQLTSKQRFLLAMVSFVPVQICRAEDNMLRLLQNGQNIAESAKGTSSGDEGDASGTDAAKIAQTIRFGLLSPLLESWNGRCVVVTSMGKQSTGKSYFLNHLASTSFAISGSRCTDGAWMSLRFLSKELLLVILDFEGLGSFERSEEEDVFLSVLNASVSLFTVFRMESRFDKDTDGVVDELVTKLDAIFEANKDQNFLTEMYAGQLEINCTPPFGTMDYYQCMENEAAQALCRIVFPSEGVRTGFVTGKTFLDCVRIVLAKISILDWTGMIKSTQNLVVADTKQKLPGILRTGCHVSLPLVADKIIPTHLKEDVLQVNSFEKIVVSLQVMCETNPGYKTKWMALNDVVPLDSIRDEELDMGFDVTSLTGRTLEIVQKAIGLLFQFFLNLRGKTYGTSKLSTEDQSGFDAFETFVLHRRKKKVSLWLYDSLSDHLSAVRSQLEQRYAEPLIVYMSRCQQRCIRCQLGCMYSVTHSPETEHNCCMDHKCRGQCEYGECQTDAARVPACSRSAGHEGKCECEKGEHTCGQPCVLIRALNCDKTCSKRAEHTGGHSCSVQVHICGVTCSATTCTATCLLDVQRDHSVHKCAEVQCFHPCLMEGCNNVCSEKNHFHGQQTESCAFAKENGIAGVGDEPADNVVVTHICSCSHACKEMCTVEGICEQKVHLKKSARTYTGARGSFEYIYQEMNGYKKGCACIKRSGEVNHEGLGHTCLVETNEKENEQHTVHYCDARCPSCNYYCNKHFGHMELHATSHGNMQQTYFMAKGNDIDVEDRKYQVGERGIVEMCNLFCAKVGRGHAHYLSCESIKDEKCVYTSGRQMDELLHAQFWTAIEWEDPCSEEERGVFAKCAFQCNAPEHEADKKLSCCVLDAWHEPEFKAEEGDDGFAFFGNNRLSDGGEDDLISYITFDSASHIVCEGESLPEALKMSVPFTGGGTSYREGLRAADEVLSRNNFEEFKSVLIFFSDGRPDDIGSGVTLAQHIRSTYAKYDLKAFVVGFGRVKLSVLHRLAAEMGGEYRQVLNASALSKPPALSLPPTNYVSTI